MKPLACSIIVRRDVVLLIVGMLFMLILAVS